MMTRRDNRRAANAAAGSISPQVLGVLAIGVVALSQSGNLIRLSAAHPVAIAAWRLLFAGLLFLPFAAPRLGQLRGLSKGEAGWLLGAAAALFFHFYAWIAAVQNTTVANAAIVISINPVFTATVSHFVFGETITKKLVLSTALGIVGVVIIGWSDLSFASAHLVGDGLALLASVIFTVYLLIGKRLRKKLSTPVYVSAIYLLAALFGFLTLAGLDAPFFSYTNRDWLCFFLMALIPTMIGHTALNNTLKHMGAGRVSVAVLTEPLLAGLVAYLAWDEAMSLPTFLGYTIIAAAVVVLSLELRSPAPSPPDP